MKKYYVFLSSVFQTTSLFPFKDKSFARSFANAGTYELIEVPEFGSLEGVEVTGKTRIIAFLEWNTETQLYTARGNFYAAIIGTPHVRCGRLERILGPSGQVLYEGLDEGLGDFSVIPPEVFGLTGLFSWKSPLEVCQRMFR